MAKETKTELKKRAEAVAKQAAAGRCEHVVRHIESEGFTANVESGMCHVVSDNDVLASFAMPVNQPVKASERRPSIKPTADDSAAKE